MSTIRKFSTDNPMIKGDREQIPKNVSGTTEEKKRESSTVRIKKEFYPQKARTTPKGASTTSDVTVKIQHPTNSKRFRSNRLKTLVAQMESQRIKKEATKKRKKIYIGVGSCLFVTLVLSIALPLGLSGDDKESNIWVNKTTFVNVSYDGENRIINSSPYIDDDNIPNTINRDEGVVLGSASSSSSGSASGWEANKTAIRNDTTIWNETTVWNDTIVWNNTAIWNDTAVLNRTEVVDTGVDETDVIKNAKDVVSNDTTNLNTTILNTTNFTYSGDGNEKDFELSMIHYIYAGACTILVLLCILSVCCIKNRRLQREEKKRELQKKMEEDIVSKGISMNYL